MTHPSLSGKEVCITGRMASMSREEGIRRIEAAAGSFVPMPESTTSVLVVGQHGPPLDDSGEPTRALLRARQLLEQGGRIEILPEREFLVLLQAPELVEDLERLYTSEQIARILDVPLPRIRSWVESGLLRPARRVRRMCFFDFQQVASAKALRRWLDEGVPAPRIHKSLRQLQRWIPDAASALAQLVVLEKTGPLLVRLADGALAEPTGQLRFDFEHSVATEREPEPEVRLHPRAAVRDWFQAGLKAEEDGRYLDAVNAWRRAIEQTGQVPEVWFNMGNAYYALRRLREAEGAYRKALELDPEYVEAWNNLGNALADLGSVDESIVAYRRALALVPDYADAHYNLAETLHSLGRTQEARPHWRSYLALDPGSPWADRARAMLGSS